MVLQIVDFDIYMTCLQCEMDTLPIQSKMLFKTTVYILSFGNLVKGIATLL